MQLGWAVVSGTTALSKMGVVTTSQPGVTDFCEGNQETMTVPILDVFIESEMQLSKKIPAVVQEHRCARTHVVGRQRRRGFLERYLLGALQLRLYRCTDCQKAFYGHK